MDKELVRKWVEALRSGEYGQTKDVLANGANGFCCLGVACAVALGTKDVNIIKKYAASSCMIYPATVRNALGLNKDVKFRGTTQKLDTALMTMNDCASRSFDAIADYIEGVLLSE